MLHKNKIKTLLAVSVFVLVGEAAVRGSYQQERNLKVLPKDISDQKLDSIMQTYNKALGVACDFCHAKKAVFPGDLDFASDKEPMKEEARKMMRMTIEINKNNFWFNKEDRPEYLHTVTCKTCHKGEPFPLD
ncbi:MAG TPA: c-type cytochrome [Chitinophagaceae bacterium]|nr:c-type cytochrome [Chitinophagaceae bacterium]